MILISKYVQLQNQTTIQSLHAKKKKKKKIGLTKISEKDRKDHNFVSFRVFLFHGNTIFSELSFK